ncbi:MAG: hypothetical protein LBQ60_19140 [Bacteroidales bacterium]|jgi:hypothetical protein|nr:hypothetical protein [Bacteroidales bacterium]
MKQVLNFSPIWVLVFLIAFTACGNEDDYNMRYNFKSLAANGSEASTTSMLMLEFCRDIEGLVVADIVLNAGETGATKGELTSNGSGKYNLTVDGITKSGEISVVVEKEGRTISPASRAVTIYYYVAP